MGVLYLSRNTIHLAENGSEEGTLSATDGSDDSSQATLLDGHVDIMNKRLRFLSVLVISRGKSIVFLGPLERSAGDTNGIGVDRVSIRGNWESLGSHQEGIDTAPGSSSDCTSTEEWIEGGVSKQKKLCNIPEELRKSNQRLDQHGEEGDGREDTSGSDRTLILTKQ